MFNSAKLFCYLTEINSTLLDLATYSVGCDATFAK